jgi:hypothetical protein
MEGGDKASKEQRYQDPENHAYEKPGDRSPDRSIASDLESGSSGYGDLHDLSWLWQPTLYGCTVGDSWCRDRLSECFTSHPRW